jgi:hypothetical protein
MQLVEEVQLEQGAVRHHEHTSHGILLPHASMT